MPTNFEFIRGTSSAAMGWCLCKTMRGPQLHAVEGFGGFRGFGV